MRLGVQLVAQQPSGRANIGDEIPATLYVAVAQILTYVFQLRVAKRAGQQPPPKPDVAVQE